MKLRPTRHVLVTLALGVFACSNDHNNNGVDASVIDSGTGATAGHRGSGGTGGSSGVSGGGSSGRGGAGGSSGGRAGGSFGGADAAAGGSGGSRGGADGGAIVDAGPSDAGVAAFSAAEWIGLLDTVNSGEIQEAQLAQTKAMAAEVKGFATDMVTDHTAGLSKDTATAMALSVTPRKTAVSANLQAQVTATMTALNKLSAAAFDRAYMQAQVTQHAMVLSLLDVGILTMGGSPDASTPDASAATPLLTLLEQTRAVVREHLQMANGVVAGLP